MQNRLETNIKIGKIAHSINIIQLSFYCSEEQSCSGISSQSVFLRKLLKGTFQLDERQTTKQNKYIRGKVFLMDSYQILEKSNKNSTLILRVVKKKTT